MSTVPKAKETEMDSAEDEPRFQTESPEDAVEILGRAANYAEATYRGEVVAAELRMARDYVREEML